MLSTLRNPNLRNHSRFLSSVTAAIVIAATPALATWSIIIVDTKTGEVAIGQATCIANFNLEAGSGVVVIGKGAGCAQSAIDSSGNNRLIMFQGFQSELPLAQILAQLSTDPIFQQRQYGMVALYGGGDSATFTGLQCGAYANGVVGQIGTIKYAIQGNVLTGAPVVTSAEQAVLNTPGDVGQKLLAAMKAAAKKGGDGRCSCSPVAPTSCGSPPPNFSKSAHVGYMLIGRIGDVDGGCNVSTGCASGNYYMNLNVIGGVSSPDPIKTLATLYDTWRNGWIGHADHVLSQVSFDQAGLPADGASQCTMTIQLKDINGTPLATGGANVVVSQDSSGAQSCTIGPVQDLGNGSYKVVLTAGLVKGVDVFKIVVNDGKGNVTLYPFPKIPIAAQGISYGPGTPGTGGQVPALDGIGGAVVGNPNYQFRAQNVLAGAPVSFVAAAASANISFSPTGTLLVDPFQILWAGGPVNASGGGVSVVGAPIPNDPLLSGLHAFVQAIALDAGGDAGVSATQGLDIEIL